MIDFYIKGTNRGAVLNALSAFKDNEGGLIQSHEVIFDTDGDSDKGIPIILVKEIIDGQGNIITPAMMSTDFHMNARINDDPHLNPKHTMTPERALELKNQLEDMLGNRIQPTPTVIQRRWARTGG